ncbi:peptidase T [Flectobacillus major]|uniref:peptidase T n=1 Tax=Flectobacillus major TaxID=103 RepID=UPI00040500AA|nr:peptidase T [Flectobacillus major]
MLINYQNTVTERFLRYVQIDTQSNPASETQPSTEKQKHLSQLLVKELQEMGITDAQLDEYGYVYATIPANTTKNVPVLCFCAHVDTSPDCSGQGVKPIIHTNYQGQDLMLPDDTTQVIRLKEHVDLAEQIGNDIITASGTTLLGADNKAGVAEIMDAAYYLMTHPNIQRGKVRILFTPDEEIGRGTAKVDLAKLGADYGYTIDGETLGSLEDETFSADGVIIKITGVSQHPGFAKGKMESALKIAAQIVANLPQEKLSPETTEGKEGFIHPVGISGAVEQAEVSFIIRDFTDSALQAHEAILKNIMDEVLLSYPNSKATFEVHEQYRNMKVILDQYPSVIQNAIEGIERSGIKAKQMSIRGGTDGSRLSFMGLPCPNIFAGEHAFHGKHEWVSVQDMEKAVETIVNICRVWEEKA